MQWRKAALHLAHAARLYASALDCSRLAAAQPASAPAAGRAQRTSGCRASHRARASARTLGQPLPKAPRARPPGVQPQHVARDRRQPARRRPLHARRSAAMRSSNARRARAAPAVVEQPACSSREHCGAVVGLATEHDAVATSRSAGQALRGGAQAAVDTDRTAREIPASAAAPRRSAAAAPRGSRFGESPPSTALRACTMKCRAARLRHRGGEVPAGARSRCSS